LDHLHQRLEADCHYGTVSLSTAEWSGLCKAIVGREFLDKPQISVTRPNPELLSRLRQLHSATRRLATDAPSIFEQPEALRALEQELMHVMVRCLSEGAEVETATRVRQHHAIVARFREFLEANPDRPIYLAEICRAIATSERTLRASCEEHLGMGPN